MPNRLAGALSPYLRQHAENPVDWWPWCEDAFAEARRRDVPVLLSVGYAACHWCHVMAHESFEDPTTAALMNDRFVSIKVDREERPDIDAVYMEATQALTGRGGWPMTAFLDHDGHTFYAGTYFPPRRRHGLPSFRDVLHGVDQAWRTDRPRVAAMAVRLDEALQQVPGAAGQAATGSAPDHLAGVTLDDIVSAVDRLADDHDRRTGGFGGAPKFPPSLVLEFLLRAEALIRRAAGPGLARTSQEPADAGPEGARVDPDPAPASAADAIGPPVSAMRRAATTAHAMTARTLAGMARGGMYDQLEGGFARYSVDADWVVPHFEKMLYDNALLARVYLHWWRATGEPLGRRIATETLDFLLTRMRTEQGGFASSLDADSEGREGACYVWTRAGLADALGPEDGEWVAETCAVTGAGTFEHGTSVLQLRADPDDPQRWARCRAALLEARSRRPQPARDDKVVAAWNGLTIAALAEGGALLDRPDWIVAAAECADLLLGLHRDPGTGHLARVSLGGSVAGVSGGAVGGAVGGAGGDAGGVREGDAVGGAVGGPGRATTGAASTGGSSTSEAVGMLEDHADLAEGLLALYQVTGNERWFTAASQLLDRAVEMFSDGTGWFHDTASDAPALVRRPRDPSDGVTPSGPSGVAQALLTRAALTGDPAHRDAADAALAALVPFARATPRFSGWTWAALTAHLAGPAQVAVVLPSDGRDVVKEPDATDPTAPPPATKLPPAPHRVPPQPTAPPSSALPLTAPPLTAPPLTALHLTALRSTSPGLVVAPGVQGRSTIPLLVGRTALEGLPTAYACRGFVCDLPTTTEEGLRRSLGD